MGRRHLFATPTGRHAWWYFLEIAGLQPGDEVLVPAYNFYVMARLLVQRGLVPVFVDVEPETLCISPAALEARIGPRSRLVLVTHMFGHPADLRRIVEICRRHGLLLFEDCAHAVGTLGDGEQVGQAGDGALFSFGVEKLVNSFGGGMLALSDEMARRAVAMPHRVSARESFTDTFGRFLITLLMTPAVYRFLLHPGERLGERLERHGLPGLRRILDPAKDDPAYRFRVDSRSGFKLFMERMHRRQLQRLEDNIARRRRVSERITAGLTGAGEARFPHADRHGRSNGSYFVLYVPDPHAAAAHLQAHGIGSSPQEFYDCSRLDQFSDYLADCPAASYASSHVLRLPSFPSLADEHCDHIAATLLQFLAAGASPRRAAS